MRLYLLFAISSMVIWGCATILLKLSTHTYTTSDIMIVRGIFAIGIIALTGGATSLTGDVTLLSNPFDGDWHYLLAAGILAALAMLAYYAALDAGGPVTTVSTIEGLYFIVAALLGVFVLDETLSTTDILGIVLGALAILLIMSDSYF